ncbi:MAG TPA: hypothetical protein VGD77_07725 [Gemmatimonadaceae bacterium]
MTVHSRRTMRALGLAVAILSIVAARPRAARAQETTIRGFANVTYAASDSTGGRSGFGLGQYDLFITSRLAPRWTFLGETVFEFDETDFAVDVERVVVGYEATARLKLWGGKHHNPLGYWNTAFHHGALMQPTIERPPLVAFEDDGGVLPVHALGLMASGRDFTPAHLGFDLLVGNGIGSTPEGDNNTGKSVTVALSSQVTSALQVGVNGYVDRLAAGTPALGGDPLAQPVSQRIVGGYVAYLGPRAELISEYQRISHDPAAGPATSNDGFFAYGGWRVREWVAYARYDAFTAAAPDPYYRVPSTHGVLVGTRYDFASTATGKLELRQRKGTGDAVHELAAQIAIGF